MYTTVSTSLAIVHCAIVQLVVFIVHEKFDIYINIYIYYNIYKYYSKFESILNKRKRPIAQLHNAQRLGACGL